MLRELIPSGRRSVLFSVSLLLSLRLAEDPRRGRNRGDTQKTRRRKKKKKKKKKGGGGEGRWGEVEKYERWTSCLVGLQKREGRRRSYVKKILKKWNFDLVSKILITHCFYDKKTKGERADGYKKQEKDKTTGWRFRGVWQVISVQCLYRCRLRPHLSRGKLSAEISHKHEIETVH